MLTEIERLKKESNRYFSLVQKQDENGSKEHISKIDVETVDNSQEIKEKVFVDKNYLFYYV